jgi:hypothetical protein
MIDLDEVLARPREDRLILQFSTAAPDWRFKHLPRFCKWWPLSMVFNKNWGSGLIRRSCHSPFSHVDMVLKDGNLLGANDDINAPVIHGNPRGVAVRPPNYQKFSYRRQAIIETDRADDIRRIWSTQLGKDYDGSSLWDMISDKFPGSRDWRLDSHWFCSEGIMWAMETGYFWGPPPILWPKNRVSPTDLLMMLCTDERWVNKDTFWQPIPGLALGPDET